VITQPRRWDGQLRRQTFARAVQGSNSIEGYVAKLDDAAAIAAGDEPLEAAEETKLAIKGYSDAMTYVLQIADEDDFTYSVQLIKSLHFMMTSYHLTNRPGRWRAGSVFVQQEDTGDIVYEGPDVGDVPALMNELVARLTNENGCGSPVLVRAAMAHLNLVMIHPFKDGNGRMARCLQSLVLAREGVSSTIFMSVEEYLGHNTPAYYKALADVGGGAWHPEGDTRRWLRFILTAHLRQARTHLRRIREIERLWIELDTLAARHRLPERALIALSDAANGFRVRNQTYRTALETSGETLVSDVTASKDLRHLTELGLLKPSGEKRGRFYIAGDDLAAIRRAIVAARDPRDDTDPFASTSA
jgi:Fic family protein